MSPNPNSRETSNVYERNGFYILTDAGKVCDIRQHSETETDDFFYATSNALFGAPATFQNNTVSGSAPIPRGQLRMDGTGTFNWTFERHPERQ